MFSSFPRVFYQTETYTLFFLHCLDAKLSEVDAGIALNYTPTNHYHQNWYRCGSTQCGALQVKVPPSCQSFLKCICCGGISVRWPQPLFVNTSNFMWSRKSVVFFALAIAFHLLKIHPGHHVDTAVREGGVVFVWCSRQDFRLY